jgi:large subunit ribosomal protein L13
MLATPHTIDAANRPIGRIATEAASALLGKKDPTSTRNSVPAVTVTVINAAKTRIPEKKLGTKKYLSYSGYPDGLRTRSLGKIVSEKGAKDAIRRAVWGMLPKNTLRSRMIKNLTIND